MKKINHWGKIRLKSFNNKAEECRKCVTEHLKRNLLKLTDELDKPKDILINKDALLQSVYEVSVDLPKVDGTNPITISNDMKIDTDDNASSIVQASVRLILRLHSQRALDMMNFAVLHGSPLRIMWPQCDLDLRKSSGVNIFVKNLSDDIDNKSLYDAFSVFSNIVSSKVALAQREEECRLYLTNHHTQRIVTAHVRHAWCDVLLTETDGPITNRILLSTNSHASLPINWTTVASNGGC
ncbi:unnamed protein product [Adineta ricciae]|uniref:Uncharacterized protein n=1 Tax=Adineta ricciae TaxID=249248 RepID=A0A814W6E9_ADIRI|nr:unnamed protein product [Adineta ricciae]CAF1200817.1 unnamed protein product [Adineta ricciae]